MTNWPMEKRSGFLQIFECLLCDGHCVSALIPAWTKELCHVNTEKGQLTQECFLEEVVHVNGTWGKRGMVRMMSLKVLS